jgi:hypothetical protein
MLSPLQNIPCGYEKLLIYPEIMVSNRAVQQTASIALLADRFDAFSSVPPGNSETREHRFSFRLINTSRIIRKMPVWMEVGK